MNVKSRYLLIVLALVGLNFAAASATAARPEWVKPPVFATDDVDARMRECLRVIARKLAPDERQLQGKIKQADVDSGAVKKRGLNIMISRWDRAPQYALACLAVGENVAEANAHILRWCREYPISKDEPQEAGDLIRARSCAPRCCRRRVPA